LAIDSALLGDLPVFQGLQRGQLQHLLSSARLHYVEPETVLYHQGSRASHFFVLLNGCFKVMQSTAEGEQVLVRFCHAGEMMGIACAMALSHYPATVTAVQKSTYLAWPNAVWPDFMRIAPQVNALLWQTVGQRLQQAHQRIQDLHTSAASQRVARTLLRLVAQSGKPLGCGMDLDFPLTREDIAHMSGTTLFTVSRLLSQWKRQGIIKGGRKHIVLLQPSVLADLAHCGQKGREAADCAACLAVLNPNQLATPAAHPDVLVACQPNMRHFSDHE